MRTTRRVSMFTQAMIWTLAVTTLVMGWFPPEGHALLAPAMSAAESVSGPNRGDDLRTIQTVLETKVIQQRLEDFGLTTEEIQVRLSRLSDAQLHAMATNLDALMPGGNGLGIVIALLVIAILAVILIYLLGHRVEVK